MTQLAAAIRSIAGIPTAGSDKSDGIHFWKRPKVACSHVITGRGPAAGWTGAITTATAVAGVWSFTVVVYRMRQPVVPVGKVTSFGGSLLTSCSNPSLS